MLLLRWIEGERAGEILHGMRMKLGFESDTMEIHVERIGDGGRVAV